ncbi:MAG: hypothetical protein K2J14_08215 [Treponemataceae bacterium]|nr:hypothetical protein [Treponemataceae bacterium]
MTDFLFARPNRIDGIMSVIDLFGLSPEYNLSKDTDSIAYHADVSVIERDFYEAYAKVLPEYVK